MSRIGRGRGGSVALPLDSNLFRENTNCPSAARSAGTVGKWGITSFTSIRSSPYAFSNNVVKKPVQDQNHPLTVAPLETEAPPPKPKKFFKSRNVSDLPTTMPQPVFAPPVPARSPSPEYLPSNSSSRRRGKAGRSPGGAAREASPDPARRTKHKPHTKAARKEEPTEAAHLSPNKRYLVRNRDKVINYAEDRSNSPIPDLSKFVEPSASTPVAAASAVALPAPAPPAPAEVPAALASPTVSSPTYVKPGLVSPSNKDGKPPPIVLRISKGTSRIVSTDSNEGLTSPGSDRHSDSHVEIDPKMSPAPETMRSPKQEGLKITIKCSSFNKEGGKKKDKKDRGEEKESRSKAHKRNHRKSSDDEPLIRKVSSPQPGTENYDLYRTLASPVHEKIDPVEKAPKEHKQEKSYEEIESELAMLDSEEPVAKNSRTSPQQLTEPAPEPKPPEKMAGRAMRNRANINYNENDDGLIDDVTAGRTRPQIPKLTIPKPPKKSRRRAEALIAEIVAAQNEKNRLELEQKETLASQDEPPVDETDLINILSGGTSDTEKSENEPIKIKINKKHSLKHVQNEHSHSAELNNCGSDSPEQNDSADHSPDRAVFKSPRQVDVGSEDKPSVKLVITKKKGSIFKSKSLVNDSESSPLPARKRRHLYKHQWDDDGKGNQTPRREPEPAAEPAAVAAATAQQVEELDRVTKYRVPEPTARLPHSLDEDIEPYTSVRCAKGAKEYYTVVRNVKKAHQIQEIGEFQEFNDDVEYILDALQDNNPMSTRCLSAITLASKCTAPAFRMHVRAHGTVQKFFSALHDATNDQSLGLCTATVMFVLSQDRLNMDLDRESLELMLNLLESDVSHQNALDDCGLTLAQLAKNKERVRELCAEIKSQGKANHLDLDNITVGHLAMETLLSLTSKRAGEWFKEELRVLGGVEHIVRTIRDCVLTLQSALAAPHAEWSPPLLDVLRKADRCMRVLENVTQQNEENQLYLVTERCETGGGSGVATTLGSLLRLCVSEARRRPHPALLDAALPTVKVLVNLSHNYTLKSSLGASVVGQNVSVIEDCLLLLHNENNLVPDTGNFEFCVCVLLLLINLVQNNDANVLRLLEVSVATRAGAVPALHLLMQHFYIREELARLAEKNTDDILDGGSEKAEAEAADKKKQSAQDEVEETVAKLLARAGAHMEHSMVGAYIVLLLGHVASLSAELDEAVRRQTRHGDYQLMLTVLRKYAAFVNLTASAEAASVAHIKSTNKIIEFLESSDARRAPPSPAAQLPPRTDAAYVHNPYTTEPPPISPSDQPQDMSLSNLSGSDNSYN